MGALTDTRKRCLVDLFSPSPSPKKPRTFPPPLPTPPCKPPPPPPSRIFPPAAPLRRSVQGPQRIIRVFGLGESPSVFPPVGWALGFRRDIGNTTGKSPSPAAMGGICSKDRSHSGLKLDEYRRLVEGLQEERPAVRETIEDGDAIGNVDAGGASTSAAVSGEPVDSGKDEKQIGDAECSVEKVEEPMAMVNLESTPMREDARGSGRSPLYKDLMQESSRMFGSKLSSLNFEIKLTEKKISAIRIASEKKLEDEKPQEEEDGPFAPLTEDDENDVSLALQVSARSQLRDVLVMHKESNIEITREIIQCLRDGAWLNDEVINLYFELLKERQKRNPEKFLKCHFFNTFFYKKLTSGQEGYDFKAVRRWTTQRKIGYGLIECEKIFVPIHKEIHWCLAVINVKEEKFQYLDSLGKMDRAVVNALARYLVDEVKDKSGRVIDVKSWRKEFVDNLPLQKNGWDCGMFMVKYADFFSRGLTLTFGQEHMSYFRTRTAKEILRLKAD